MVRYPTVRRNIHPDINATSYLQSRSSFRTRITVDQIHRESALLLSGIAMAGLQGISNMVSWSRRMLSAELTDLPSLLNVI